MRALGSRPAGPSPRLPPCRCSLLADGVDAAPGLTPAKPNVVVVLTDDEPALDGRLMRLHAERPRPPSGCGHQVHRLPRRDVALLPGSRRLPHGAAQPQPRCDAKRREDLRSPHDTCHGARRRRLPHRPVGKYYNQYGRIAPIVPPGWDHWAAFGDARYYEYELWLDGAAQAEVHGRTAEDYSTDVLAAKAARGHRAEHLLGRAALSLVGAERTACANLGGRSSLRKGRVQRPALAATELERAQRDGQARLRPATSPDRRAPGTKLVALCRQLLAVDDLIGDVRDALDAQGSAREHDLRLPGDNGYFQGEHRIATGKAAPYVSEVPVVPRVAGRARLASRA